MQVRRAARSGAVADYRQSRLVDSGRASRTTDADGSCTELDRDIRGAARSESFLDRQVRIDGQRRVDATGPARSRSIDARTWSLEVRSLTTSLRRPPLAGTAEKYLKPEVIRQVARLDLRAKFIVEGFIAGLHASPFHGFSVEFSEHRKYTAGDNISDIDWNVYAKTDRFYIKKFQAETNLTGYLVMDLSGSMGYTYRQELTKFEYGISLAAALCYLMIHQQDPVGLIAFDQKVRQSLAPGSKRSQLGNILSLLAKLKPAGTTDIEASLHQVAGMIRHRSLVMLFSDLLGDPEPILRALHRLRFAGHDLIIFHILDEAEAHVPLRGDARAGGQRDARDHRGRRRCDQGRLSRGSRASSARGTRPTASGPVSTTSRCTPGCRSTRR